MVSENKTDVFIWIGVVVAIPFIIFGLSKVTCFYPFSAGELIAFVGPMALGYVTIRISTIANRRADEANEISEKLIALEENRLAPRFSVKPAGFSRGGFNFIIKNYSDNAAYDVEIDELRLSGNTDRSPVPIIKGRPSGLMIGEEEVNIIFNDDNAPMSRNSTN
jgi:hypothetical protein